MRISTWPAKARTDNQPGMMVRVSRVEALQIIASLSSQLLIGDANTNRAEHTALIGKVPHYFSIAVNDKGAA